MTSELTLLLVTPSQETGTAVSSALSSNDRFRLKGVCLNLKDLAEHPQSAAPSAVLLDIEPDPRRILADLESISGRFPDTRFIVLAESLRNDLVLEAMQAGARHFMLKRDLDSNLGAVLQRLVGSKLAASEMRGLVGTVLSVSGGCGGTTVAINLANELSLLSSKAALLVDLDCNYLGASAYLGLAGEYGIADVLKRNGELDPQLIRSTAREYSDGLRLLINPMTVDPKSPVSLRYDHLPSAIRECRRSYEFTIIDAPRVSMDTAAQLADAGDATFLILQLTVKDLAMARLMLSALKERGVFAEALTVVINRHQKRQRMVTLEDVRTTLGEIPLTCISNDYPSAIKGLNYGQPLAEAAPRSAMRRDLRAVAAKFRERCQEATA